MFILSMFAGVGFCLTPDIATHCILACICFLLRMGFKYLVISRCFLLLFLNIKSWWIWFMRLLRFIFPLNVCSILLLLFFFLLMFILLFAWYGLFFSNSYVLLIVSFFFFFCIFLLQEWPCMQNSSLLSSVASALCCWMWVCNIIS